jgi:hypothetical protein
LIAAISASVGNRVFRSVTAARLSGNATATMPYAEALREVTFRFA